MENTVLYPGIKNPGLPGMLSHPAVLRNGIAAQTHARQQRIKKLVTLQRLSAMKKERDEIIKAPTTSSGGLLSYYRFTISH